MSQSLSKGAEGRGKHQYKKMCPTEGPVTMSCALFAGKAEIAEDVWSKELDQVTSACDTTPLYLSFQFRMSMLQ